MPNSVTVENRVLAQWTAFTRVVPFPFPRDVFIIKKNVIDNIIHFYPNNYEGY